MPLVIAVSDDETVEELAGTDEVISDNVLEVNSLVLTVAGGVVTVSKFSAGA